MEFIHFSQWYKTLTGNRFLLIAGPCSAESREQVLSTAEALKRQGKAQVFRAGLWKPRTAPSAFQGVGEKGLEWLREVKERYALLTATEVANAAHVEKALHSEAIDIIWLGARTVGNPFSVQEIAEALRGVDIPVLVKNPIAPDLKLWIGAIERLYKVGIQKLAAVHRGFYPFYSNKLRNIPKWEIPINLKTTFPNLPIINDPSHIAGDVCYIHEVAQKALDLNMDGLMIEVHINPAKALSDAKQQLTPEQFAELLSQLQFRTENFGPEFIDQLTQYRQQIDSIDYQILELLAQRMQIVRKIGQYKNAHNIPIFQLKRWKQIILTRTKFAQKLNLDLDFVEKLLELIHKYSINLQSNIKNHGNQTQQQQTQQHKTQEDQDL